MARYRQEVASGDKCSSPSPARRVWEPGGGYGPTGMACVHRRLVRLPGLLLVCAVAFGACSSDDQASSSSTETRVVSSSTLPSPAGTTVPTIVEIVGTYEVVEAYPACGNEPFEHLGVTWYPLVHEGSDPISDDLQARADEVRGVVREAPPAFGVHGLVRVAPPGPGDDIGTLVVWADGVARWVSNSGDLDVWLVDDRLTYNWVC